MKKWYEQLLFLSNCANHSVNEEKRERIKESEYVCKCERKRKREISAIEKDRRVARW